MQRNYLPGIIFVLFIAFPSSLCDTWASVKPLFILYNSFIVHVLLYHINTNNEAPNQYSQKRRLIWIYTVNKLINGTIKPGGPLYTICIRLYTHMQFHNSHTIFKPILCRFNFPCKSVNIKLGVKRKVRFQTRRHGWATRS